MSYTTFHAYSKKFWLKYWHNEILLYYRWRPSLFMVSSIVHDVLCEGKVVCKCFEPG